LKDLDLIYVTARELPPEERPAYLARACEGDQVLRARVEQMLAVSAEAEAFLTDLPDEASPDLKPGREPVKDLKPGIADMLDEAVGQRIGRYKILEKVGEGGCGVVYVAEQTEPVRRRVALKVIKLKWPSRENPFFTEKWHYMQKVDKINNVKVEAFSYARWSSNKQSEGDSLRRQMSQAESWCVRHGLTLSEPRFVDSGVLAYRGKNQSAELGRLVQQLKAGDVLLVEDADRLSRQDIGLAVLGITVGLAGAWALTRLLGNLLFGLTPTDVATLVATSILLFAVALFASWLPARRAAKTDPMEALRYESLGIGASTGVVTAVQAILLQRPPYTDPDRILKSTEIQTKGGVSRATSPANFLVWQRATNMFSGMSAYFGAHDNGAADGESEAFLTGAGQPVRLKCLGVMPGLFELLGVKPLMGRSFTSEELYDNTVVMLSYGCWHSQFGSAPDIVGRSIVLGGQVKTVIGVMPPSFYFPSKEFQIYWTPGVAPGTFESIKDCYLTVVGRLGPGITIRQATGQMQNLGRQLEVLDPTANRGLQVRLQNFRASLAASSRSALLLLLAAVADRESARLVRG
jgi:hypothetical protein